MTSKCPRCAKSVYPNDIKISANDKQFHKLCFNCITCKTRLELTTYKSHQNEIYCAKCVPQSTYSYGANTLENQRASNSEKLKRDASTDRLMKEQKYTGIVDSVDQQRVKGAEESKREAGHIVRGEDKLKGDNKFTSTIDSVDQQRVKSAEESKREAGHIVRGEDKLKGDNKYSYRLSGVEFQRVKANEATKQDTFLVGGRENDRLLGDNAHTHGSSGLEFQRVKDNEAYKDVIVNPNDRLHRDREEVVVVEE